MNQNKDHIWSEIYRPHTIADCIIPDELKKIFQSYVDKKEIPHLLLCGRAGTGKTSVAKALCDQVGCDYLVINGSDESGIDTFRMKVKNFASSMSLRGGKKVIIIDEADHLNPNSTQPAMRAAMEEFAHNCTIIMTCNYVSRIIEPLQSRCAVVEFKIHKAVKPKMALAYMKRIVEILKIENVKFESAAVAEVVKKFFPDFRRTLNELQHYSAVGKIDEGIIVAFSNVSIKDLIVSLRNQNFSDMRKWVAENHDDHTVIFRKIYDSMYEFMEKSTIPNAVVILAKYQYQSAFVADQELNLVACLTEIMCEVKFT